MIDLAARLAELFDPFLPHPPAPYVLVRDTDVSGVSGTGAVAEGVYFSPAAGSAAVTRWRGERGSTVAWDRGRAGDVEAIHGHGGATRVLVLPVPEMTAALLSIAHLGEQAGGDDAWAAGWNEALHAVRGAIRLALAPHLRGVEGEGPAMPNTGNGPKS